MRVIDNNTVEVNVSYDISPVLAGSNAIASSSLFYSIGVGAPVLAKATTEVNPMGGDHVSYVLDIPAPINVITTFDFYAVETDIFGNVSPHSLDVKLTVNRLAPAAPINFTVA